MLSELNVRLGANKNQEQCSRNMQYLIGKYKEAHDWNVHQTRGDRKSISYYEEINEILGCWDGMTFRHVVGSSGAERELEDVNKSTEASDDESEDAVKAPSTEKNPRESARRERPHNSESVLANRTLQRKKNNSSSAQLLTCVTKVLSRGSS